MRNIYLVILLINSIGLSFGQHDESLTPEERAYLFHVVKKSPILDTNIGRYFDYKGPVPYFPNRNINFDSLETTIINNPELLIIRKEEIAKSSKGILGETANKMALWELNKILLAKRGSEKELEPYLSKYKRFENALLSKLPESATRTKDNETIPVSKINPLLNPGISFDDKKAFVESMRLPTVEEEKQVIDAISFAVNDYVSNRSREIYEALGGIAEDYENILVAAGDGSSTSGLLEEREKDEKGRWNKGLPKAVGFFPYQTMIEPGEKKKPATIEPMRHAIIDLETAGDNKVTNVHFDVWGYNSEKQTTVVIERNGLSYPLFGSSDTRFLSPDSSFSNGTTLQAVINDLEKNKIGDLYEKIYGKKGYDYWIDYNKKKKDEVELKIEKNEYGYSTLHSQTLGTDKKATRKEKKARKGLSHPDDSQNSPRLTNESEKKKKRKGENNIVDLYARFEAYKKKIAELEKEKSEAIDLMAIYQQRLDTYKRLFGYKWAKYEENDGMYIFEDSSTFDIMTQDFTFAPRLVKEPFEVRLIAIPESSLSKNADEVMLHIHKTDGLKNYDARLQIALGDVFGSDQYQLSSSLLSNKDSVAVMQFFEGLLDRKVPFSITARGAGVGRWDGSAVVKELHPTELSSYPKDRNDPEFARLRKSELLVSLNRSIKLEINSYTDPVKSNLEISNEEIKSLMSRYKLNKNDILSAYRTAAILSKFKEEINVLAGTYLSREEAKIVIDRFNNEYNKTRVSIGATSIKIQELK